MDILVSAPLKRSLAATWVALCLAATGAVAQSSSSSGMKKEQPSATRDRWAALKLTPDQRTQIAAIEAEEKQLLATLPADDHDGRARVQRTVRGQIRALLTPEQQARFDEMTASKAKREDK